MTLRDTAMLLRKVPTRGREGAEKWSFSWFQGVPKGREKLLRKGLMGCASAPPILRFDGSFRGIRVGDMKYCGERVRIDTASLHTTLREHTFQTINTPGFRLHNRPKSSIESEVRPSVIVHHRGTENTEKAFLDRLNRKGYGFRNSGIEGLRD
jgi:hypothetical protein